jgi:hypothetical protein
MLTGTPGPIPLDEPVDARRVEAHAAVRFGVPEDPPEVVAAAAMQRDLARTAFEFLQRVRARAEHSAAPGSWAEQDRAALGSA